MLTALLLLAFSAPLPAQSPVGCDGRATPGRVELFFQAESEPTPPAIPAKPSRAEFGPLVGPAAWLAGVI